MIRYYVGIIIILCFSMACNNENKANSPLAIVIKLQAAETLADFEEAKKYIDVEKVYSNHPDSINPEEAWKESITFFYNLGNDKKFTNVFKYYKYDIREAITKDKATVSFKALSSGDSIKEILYTLELYKNDWKIIGIDYIK
jgi:hypothetical protein